RRPGRHGRRTWVTSLIGTLRFDDDYAVGAPHAVHRLAGGVLHHLDGGDVVRIDSREAAARSGLDLDAVDDVQWLVAAAERGGAADAHRNAAVRCTGHHHAGEPPHQYLLDRLARLAVDVFGGQYRAGGRHGGVRLVPMDASSAKAQEEPDGEKGAARKPNHRRPPAGGGTFQYTSRRPPPQLLNQHAHLASLYDSSGRVEYHGGHAPHSHRPHPAARRIPGRAEPADRRNPRR